MKNCIAIVAVASLTGFATADVITVHTSRPSYDAANSAPQTIEDFTPTSHFPIVSGVLNSLTTDAGLNPGEIEEGVTYSTPIGQGNFFNIDAGGGYSGGFLDGFEPSDRDVTIVFHQSDPNDLRSVNGFGFDFSGSLGASTVDVTISFSSGPDQTFNVPYLSGFYGFTSDARDITGAVVSNNDSFFGFDFDNFTYDEVGAGLMLEITTSCPASGPATLTATGGSGGTIGFVYTQNGAGSFTIPGGFTCAGTQLGLNPPVVLGGSASGDPAVVNVGSVPGIACGNVTVQAIDASTCETSNVVVFN